MKHLKPYHPAMLLGIAALTAVLLGAQQATAETKAAGDAVVAVVNADPITRQQLAEEVVRRYGDEVLDGLVNRHLILQACQAKNIEITAEQVRDEVVRIARGFSLTPESYLKLLQDERDISPEQYSREIIWPLLSMRALVADQVEVTPEEINKALMSQFGEAVKCRLIMIKDRPTADKVHQLAKADPSQFGALAKQYSEDEASASVRGLIPPIRRYSGDPDLEAVVFGLQEQEVSDVVQLGDHWIILQAVKHLPATPPTAAALPAVRQQIIHTIRDEKVRVEGTKLFASLQAKAEVVKVLGDPQKSQQYPGVAAIINGHKMTIAQLSAECLKYHGRTVLDGEINRKLLTQALKKAGATVQQADLDAEIARAAAAYGYVDADGQADVGAWLTSVIGQADQKAIDLYIRDAVWPTVALKKLVQGQVEVTEEDLRKGYEANFGPRVEVLAIMLSDQRTAQKVWDMARANPTDKFFGELAAQYSVEPVSQSNLGKVPPIRRYGGQPAIEQEAFNLKPGELSGIIATGDRYLVLRCQGYTEPVFSEIEAVRVVMMRDIAEKKERLAMADAFDDLKETAQIDNFLAGTSQTGRVAQAPAAAKAPAAR